MSYATRGFKSDKKHFREEVFTLGMSSHKLKQTGRHKAAHHSTDTFNSGCRSSCLLSYTPVFTSLSTVFYSFSDTRVKELGDGTLI